jgi:hypothetical protein
MLACDLWNLLRYGWLLVLGFPGFAAAPVPPVPGHLAAFESFKALAGNWRGEGRLPETGEFRDAYRFEVAAGGRFVRADYRMEGLGGRQFWHDFGAYGLDPLTGEMFSSGYGSDGATASGKLQAHGEGRWVFIGRTDGSAVYARYRFTLQQLGDSRLLISTEVPDGDKWRMLYAAQYERQVP